MDKKHLVSTIFKRLKEISATGGGGGAASFSPGSGPQYATPFAFKKTKNNTN